MNHNLNADAEDIPISWTENNITKTGFADVKSMKIRNTTKLYPSDSILHPSYYIEGRSFTITLLMNISNPYKSFLSRFLVL